MTPTGQLLNEGKKEEKVEEVIHYTRRVSRSRQKKKEEEAEGDVEAKKDMEEEKKRGNKGGEENVKTAAITLEVMCVGSEATAADEGWTVARSMQERGSLRRKCYLARQR